MSDLAPKKKVLLIGWDAADWESINPLLEEGLMPTLDGLINRGVMGNLATLNPILSPMLWNSIATGKSPDKHGIHGFIEPDPVNGGARPYTSTSRKCKAIWNILTQVGLRSNVVGWWASHPAEPINGNVVTNAFSGVRFDPERGWSIPPGTVHPKEKAMRLAPFRCFPTEITEQHVLPFIPDAAKIDQKKDKRLDPFAKILSDAATIHAVATALMESEPADFTAVYYDAVDHFSHAFMQYNPPKLEWIRQEDFDLYKDVVRGAYRFHDMMLERLLDLAGPDTTVILCSDHGFESGSQRPRGVPREPAGPAIWHRHYGIIVMAGPGIKKDERIYGASIIDITPTLLTLFGLPIGEDMDGRPLLEAFEDPPKIDIIPSWESRDGAAGMHTGDGQMDPDQSRELMQQFAALGYIEDPTADKEKQAESADIEAKYNLARTYLWKNRPRKALPLLEELVKRRPWEDRFLVHLGSTYLQAGFARQAERLVSAAFDLEKSANASVLLLWGRIKLQLGETSDALERFVAAQKLAVRVPAIQTQIGDIYQRRLRWKEAEEAYLAAIKLDPDYALAHQGLSTVYRRFGDSQKMVDSALRAIGLVHRLPIAHFNIGVGMARSGHYDRARLAFETALRFKPDMLNAHRYLATILKELGDVERAKFHRREAARLLKAGLKARTPLNANQEKLFDLPEIPSLEERQAILLRERPDPKPAEQSGKTFVLVSGLPRSGTSLMMQMLAAGGLAPITDHERVADVDNPKGYYEWEKIKQIARNPEILDEEGVDRGVIKCISMLLPKLPAEHHYKIIFMTRPIAEVVASQHKMVERLGTQGAKLDQDQLRRGLLAHRNEARAWLRSTSNVEAIEIDYPALVRDPGPHIKRIVDFLGLERLPSHDQMSAVIDQSLHRRKSPAST